MKVALIMTTVICITNGTAESKFESIWSAEMVKTITEEVMKRYFANCVYLLHSPHDQGEVYLPIEM
jgi:cyclopropane fatty-acyl-phospholipid synthase-like methyltransferase